MASRLDEILSSLLTGKLTLDEACRATTAAARESPNGAQLWPMLIEAKVAQRQLSTVAARALTEALQNFEPEKTLWIAPTKSSPRTPPESKPAKPEQLAIDTPEELSAYLWNTRSEQSQVKNSTAAGESSRVAPPPRPMLGATHAAPIELGTVLKNRYRLESRLGLSGIGQIFNAVDLNAVREGKSNSRLTIKIVAVNLYREPQALMAMKIAVAKIKFLDHANIVRTFGVDNDNERLFITMEPLSGRWLGERVRSVRNVGISQDLAWPIIEGVAKGLAYAHAQDVVHSNLSPYAVFVTDDGTPKIMGFGLVHALPTSNEQMDLMDTMTLRAYTEAYTANPWATHATPRPADDMYPLGVMAYELLTGKHPFQRCTLATARQRGMRFESVPGLKRRAARLISRCLSFERKERPSDARRFLARLSGPMWVRFLFGELFSRA